MLIRIPSVAHSPDYLALFMMTGMCLVISWCHQINAHNGRLDALMALSKSFFRILYAIIIVFSIIYKVISIDLTIL